MTSHVHLNNLQTRAPTHTHTQWRLAIPSLIDQNNVAAVTFSQGCKQQSFPSHSRLHIHIGPPLSFDASRLFFYFFVLAALLLCACRLWKTSQKQQLRDIFAPIWCFPVRGSVLQELVQLGLIGLDEYDERTRWAFIVVVFLDVSFSRVGLSLFLRQLADFGQRQLWLAAGTCNQTAVSSIVTVF